MTLNIEVTKENIENGKVGQCGYCPIALAIIPKLAESISVLVFAAEIRLEKRNLWVDSIYLPTIARAFIRHFDRHEVVEPVNFSLEVPLNMEKYFKPEFLTA
jgi:hypothetical protein